MTKPASLAALGALACAFAFGAARPEASTYVDGNIATLKPHTGGTLMFTKSNAMLFRTGLVEVDVPYSGIRRAELGATQVHTHGAPLYKVWALPGRLHRTETQLLTLQFRSSKGEDRTMTLELSKPGASAVLAAIRKHTGANETTAAGSSVSSKPAADDWWGDKYWKTTRNAAQWSTEEAAATSR
jgi:hypothetical protein